MPYRELTMIDVREILRRWQAGQSDRKVARETGTDRKTVARYTEHAEQLGLPRDRALTDGEVHEVAQCVQARALPPPSSEWQDVAVHKEQIAAWLGAERPLKLRKIHVLLQREGVTASYQTLRRFVMTELGWRQPKPTVRIDDAPPGQEAQIDFGCMGYIVDRESGRRIKLWALIVTLVHCRLTFVWPTLRQTTEAVCEGLDRAWWFLGGMPRILIPDNTKAMVIEPDALAARLTDAFADYLQARGIFADPARVRSPRDKARVENQVPYVRESWFDGEDFGSLEEARISAEHWAREVAGRRVHGTTRRVPWEVYEEVERATMLAAPSDIYDVPQFVDAKVHPDHHIEVKRALYSVPSIHRRKKVRVRVDSKSVRIYAGSELVKTHRRQPPGGRSTDPRDYPDGKALYALRSVDALLDRARKEGKHVGRFVERLLDGPLPWTKMRQAYALLRLCEKYGTGRVEAVCQSALGFDVLDVRTVTRMVQRPQVTPEPDSGRCPKVVQLPLPLPRFARATTHFETITRRDGGEP